MPLTPLAKRLAPPCLQLYTYENKDCAPPPLSKLGYLCKCNPPPPLNFAEFGAPDVRGEKLWWKKIDGY